MAVQEAGLPEGAGEAGGAARTALLLHVHGELAAPLAAVVGSALRLAAAAEAPDLTAVRGDCLALGRAGRALAGAVEDLLHPHWPAGSVADLGGLRAALRHQLNTPIDALRGTVDLLLEDAAASSLRPALASLAAACDRLLWAVDAVTRFATEPACLPALTGAVAAASGPLLLVDADEAGRQALQRRLARRGHRVRAVAGEEAALAALADGPFDLLLLDLGPRLEAGLDLLCRLKGRSALRDVPVLVMSTLTEAEAAGRCIAAGAEDYLAKPLNGPLLYARVAASLERKRLRDVERAHLDRLQWELTTARRLQSSMLPRSFPPVPGLEGHGLTVPAREVGGDFFDFIPLPDGRLGIAVGDVSGKGVPASFLMGVVRGLLRIAATVGMAPGACLERLNAMLCENNDQAMFVTLVYGIVDPARGSLTYANAGHNPPLLLSADGGSYLPSTEGPALAVFPGTGYADATVALTAGDLVLLYTDGIVESLDPQGAAFGSARLAEAAARRCPLSVQELVDGIVEDVRVFAAGQPPLDDIACAAVRLTGTEAVGVRGGGAGPVPAIELRFAAKLGELRRLGRILDGFGLAHGLPERQVRHLGLAVDEAVTNVIRHAFADDPAANEIHVRIALAEAAVRVEIVDAGVAFDPTALPGPQLDLPLCEMPVGGLGVHIMRSLVDSVEYRRDRNTNRLILVKRIGAAGRGRRR